MLEQLDNVPWEELGHAYGFAEDVPDLIRDLIDPERRKKALDNLYGNIFHQGTRYEATPYAIPFLYELIESEETPQRDHLVYFLVGLALGYESEYLPEGVDVADFRQNREEYYSRASPAERADWALCGMSPRTDLACYDAVREGVPKLIPLLSCTDPALRRAAAYALAWFPENASKSLPSLQVLTAGESSESGIANAVLSLGLLVRSSKIAWPLEPQQVLLSHTSKVVRTAAAIALARNPLPDAVVDVLLGAVCSPELQELGEEIQFHGGDLARFAALVLTQPGSAALERLIPTLSRHLRSTDFASSMEAADVVVHLVLRAGTIAGNAAGIHSVSEVSRQNLTTSQAACSSP